MSDERRLTLRDGSAAHRHVLSALCDLCEDECVVCMAPLSGGALPSPCKAGAANACATAEQADVVGGGCCASAPRPLMLLPCGGHDGDGPSANAEPPGPGVDAAHFAAAFRRIDKNGDGVLSRIEVIQAAKRDPEVRSLLGLPAAIRQEDGTRDAFEAVFQRLDADSSRTITAEEFVRALASAPPPPAPTRSTPERCQWSPRLRHALLHGRSGRQSSSAT